MWKKFTIKWKTILTSSTALQLFKNISMRKERRMRRERERERGKEERSEGERESLLSCFPSSNILCDLFSHLFIWNLSPFTLQITSLPHLVLTTSTQRSLYSMPGLQETVGPPNTPWVASFLEEKRVEKWRILFLLPSSLLQPLPPVIVSVSENHPGDR